MIVGKFVIRMWNNMKHIYELNKEDIVKIIAKKFNCNPSDVYLREEKEYARGTRIETIKATVKVNEVLNMED